MIYRRIATLLIPVLLVLLSAAPASGETSFTVDNPLNLHWPWELTYKDFSRGTFGDEPLAVRMNGRLRPAQLERTVSAAGRQVDRLWFIATLPRSKQRNAANRHKVTIVTQRAASDLRLRRDTDHMVIANGLYEYRVPNLPGRLVESRPLHEMPPIHAGMRLAGGEQWWSTARFDGRYAVSAATTEIIQQGPVFIDVKFTYVFEGSEQPEGTTPAVPLAMGKQSHTFPPNKIPTVEVPKYDRRYEAVMRFVWGDPWIEVNERFRLPRDRQAQPWGICQYNVDWGQVLPIDTVMWIRWFDYGRFGGNTSMHFYPPRRRAKQAGPFVKLRPRWNQGPGGGQDFFLTSGGPSPYYRKKMAEPYTDAAYDPNAPAVGLVAAFPTKWVEPYANTIAAYADDGDRGYARFPLVIDHRSGLYYSQRSYGMCVGPRKLFDGTGKVNALVRRHTDWTLAAQMNKYILRWQRDPEQTGPNILISRDELGQIRSDLDAGRDTPAVAVVQRAREEYERLKALDAEYGRLRKAARGRGDDADAAQAAKDELQKRKDEFKEARKQLDSQEIQILRAILGEKVSTQRPTAHLWLQRRYQDDFLNPTSSTVRKFNHALPLIDLFQAGEPYGGPLDAAGAYIFSDLDHWPGWHNGWSPGNPNFHTDKYMVALYLGAIMQDHPHADQWLAYGRENFSDDIRRVLTGPDGVGYECPGYAAYSLSLQLAVARLFKNLGAGNPVADNPLFAKTGRWHRKLLTPEDQRFGFRHSAPIGDTHRWGGAKEGSLLGKLAAFYGEANPAFASEMMGVYDYFRRKGVMDKYAGVRGLLGLDLSIEPMALERMDWSSEAFHGFGAILRNRFDTDDEAFVTLKAGPVHGHYHNDELSYHAYLAGHPVSLDYNCSYSPRGDHAALHNSMTFGLERRFTHRGDSQSVPAAEQLFATAWVGAFASSPAGDAVVAERSSNRLTLSPIYPRHAKFSYQYPSRKVAKITHRRLLALVKHGPDSPFQDYLVIRDEVSGKERQQLNVHLLARSLQRDPNDRRLLRAPGQYDADMLVYLADAANPKIDQRSWHYVDPWMASPGQEYELREGETQDEYVERMNQLMEDKRVRSLPLPGWQPRWQPPEQNRDWLELIAATDGRALMPPPHWKARWMYGEVQNWLRVTTDPGTPVLWVLYARKADDPEPTFETIAGGKGVRVSVNGRSEEVFLATEPASGVPGQAVIRRDGRDHILLAPAAVPALGDIPHEPLHD